MSAPTRQLGKLSIHSRGSQGGRGRGNSARGIPDAESDSSSSGDSSVPENAAAMPRSGASTAKGKQRAEATSPTDLRGDSPSQRRARAERTRDILATFHQLTLPDDLRSDIFDRIEDPRTPAECLRQLDLEGTVFQLAVNDYAVFKSLSEAQPVQARAIDFFQKVKQLIDNTLKSLDTYARTGEADVPQSPPSIQGVGDQLVELAELVAREVRQRHPHGGEQAAGCLLHLLQQVCDRNYDMFEDNTWGHQPRRGELAEDRNLFHYLIGGQEDDPSSQSEFVLDALMVVPGSVLAAAATRTRLEEISEQLRQQRAPQGYRRAFQRILNMAAAESSNPLPAAATQTGQKRPAAGNGIRGGKRGR